MTKLNRLLTTLFALVLLSPLAARAASIEAESIEFDTRFSFQHNSVSEETPVGDDDFGITVLDLRAGLGYFFNPNWEILGSLIVNHFGIDDASITDFGIRGNVLYHFNTSGSIIPFVGAGVGMVVHGGDVGPADDETTVVVPELIVGLRWPFEEVVSLNTSAGYRHIESPFGIEDSSGDEFFLAFGFSFFLQGGATQ